MEISIPRVAGEGGCGVLRDPGSAVHEDVGSASPVLGIRRAAQERESESGVSVETLWQVERGADEQAQRAARGVVKQGVRVACPPRSIEGCSDVVLELRWDWSVDMCRRQCKARALPFESTMQRNGVELQQSVLVNRSIRENGSTESWELVEPEGGGACNGWLRFEHYTL